MDDMDDIVEEFLVESYENLDRLDLELVELEEQPDSAELLASIFRNLHTIKGTAGFFGFSHLESLTHAGETLLSLLRTGELRLDVDITNALLGTVDAIREMLEAVEQTRCDGTDPHTELVAELHRLADPSAGEHPGTDTAVAEPAPSPPAHGAEPAPTPAAGPGASPEPAVAPNPSETSIRVDVSLLDRLMNLVGELVLARNQVLQYHTDSGDPTFQTTSQQLDLITTELQEGVMKTRMQPIGNVWSKLPRVVRDLAASCAKKVRLEMEGEDTELDKTLLEAIKDPLTHIVRNSIDHGLESPDERIAAGKPETGLLKLRALHEGGQVILEIIDDGAGLDLERIKAKAISSGIVSTERAATMSDRDVAHLIFRPGFSTAAAVTNVSGRGVGMDVVKTNVEKIGGSLEIQSQPGTGTTLTIKIPLTLAIIPALIITSDGDRYLIPQINLVEVLRVDDSSGDTKIEMAGDAPVLRLRGNLLPIIHLRDVLGLPDADVSGEGVSIAVLHADGFQFGLVVDQINDTEEIVVKPLSPHLKGLGAFAGTTIMGDGAVSLILDAIGIARHGGVLRGEEQSSQIDSSTDPNDRRGSTQMVLVCTVGDNRIGIPLALVSRLEELPADQVERASGHDVIQYRGRLLRLIHLRDVLGTRHSPEVCDDVLKVLVYETSHAIHGLVVDEIVDVFEADLSDCEAADRAGLQMSGVIGRRVTDLLDIDRIVAESGGVPALAGTRSM